MAQVRKVRSSVTQNDQSLLEGLKKIKMKPIEQSKLKDDELQLAFREIPADILVGEYSVDQIKVLAKQIAILENTDYDRFSRYVFARLIKYYSAVLYVSNRLALLGPKEVIEKTVPRGNFVSSIRLTKADAKVIRRQYNVAVTRVANLLRSHKKTVRAGNTSSNVMSAAFAAPFFSQMLVDYSDVIFSQGYDFAGSFPHAANGELILNSVMHLLYILAFKHKIAELENLQAMSLSKLKTDIKSYTPQQLKQTYNSHSIGGTSFPPEIIQFLRQQIAIHTYVENKGKLQRVANRDQNLTTELSIYNAELLSAQLDNKESVGFSYESFANPQITRMEYAFTITDTKVPKDEYRAVIDGPTLDRAYKFLATASNQQSPLYAEMLAEHEALKEYRAQLRARKVELAKPFEDVITLVKRQAESRKIDLDKV